VLFVESTGLRAPSRTAARSDLSRIGARLAGFFRGVRQVSSRLHVLSPLALPGAGPPALRRRSLGWIAAQTGRAAARLGLSRPILWAFLPTAIEMPDRLRSRLCVYHCVDHYAANPGVDPEWIGALEARMLRRADVVFATSPVLADRLGAMRRDVVSVPNVADVTLFSRALEDELPEPGELAGLSHPRLVYVGNLAAYRVDFELLLAAAREVPGVTLVLIGGRGLGDVTGASESERALVGRDNVRVIGPRPQEALPAYLRHCDAALIPFLDNEHTQSSLPLKLWEYLAAGLPVVARQLPGLEREAGDLLHLAGDPASFVGAVKAALAEPAERRRERSARARSHDWSARMDRLCGTVGAALEATGSSSQREGTPL